ncbi:hypothetical protein C8R44DRAFT_338405 [Mycena epipterygia]|nr:hypothetical protein C8R44DRAFT_338405 [Mycena epipterygia]
MSDQLDLTPKASNLAEIAHVRVKKKSRTVNSRIGVVVEAGWDTLVSDSAMGRALRRPYWRAFCDHDDQEFEPVVSDKVLQEYFSCLRKPFLACLVKSDDLCYAPMGDDMDHEHNPTLCFSYGHHKAVERIRKKIAKAEFRPSSDDVAELRQLDIATATGFLRELAHILWRARFPASTNTPEKFRAKRRTKADKGEGEGGEIIEDYLYGEVVDCGILNMARLEAAQGHFYDSWNQGLSLVPEYDSDRSDGEDSEQDSKPQSEPHSDGSDSDSEPQLKPKSDSDARFLCHSYRHPGATLYLTRQGAQNMCRALLDPLGRDTNLLRRPHDFISLGRPEFGVADSPFSGKSKRQPTMLVDSSSVLSIELSHALHTLRNETVQLNLDQVRCGPTIPKLCDYARGLVRLDL